jgi:DNA-directed RNA polymerase specialized sigma24 family protein
MGDDKEQSELWINPIYDDGSPVDEVLIQIAKRLYPELSKYGKQRLKDASCVPEIVERVVHSASRLLTNGNQASIKKATTYIYRSCTYEINHAAKRERRCEQKSFEEFDAEVDPESLGWEIPVHRKLLVERLLADLDEKQLELVLLRLNDYPWAHIAKTLRTSPVSARVQYSKTLKIIRQTAIDLNLAFKQKRKGQSA